MRQPALFVPHGGGPCFFMDDPQGIWTGMAAFLRSVPALLPEPPRALLVVSGHWETRGGFALTGSAQPPLLFDYYGFPPHTYQLRYDAPGDPALAGKIAAMLNAAGLPATLDAERGYDHGVFVPLKVIYPEANIPVLELSVEHGLDPALHLRVGAALAPLRDDGVLLLCTGMSFHNMRAYRDARATNPSAQFDAWLTQSCELPAPQRTARLLEWEKAPAARISHPRHEHLLPLFVAAGSSEQPGRRIYSEKVLETMISGFAF